MWEFPRTSYMDCNGSEASEEMEIAVNIGGVKHILYGDVLNRYPETRLAELVNRSMESTIEDLSALCDDYDDLKREFYFDRDPDVFKCILDLYYYGEIHMKRGICPMCFMREIDYWGIDVEHLDECCRSNLNEVGTILAKITKKVQGILDGLKKEASVTNVRGQRWKVFLRRLISKPESSLAARVISVMSIAFVLLSTVIMCVSTIPEIRVQDAEGNLVENPIIEAIEKTCITWFTAKFILRLVSSSNKVRFARSFMNIIDFITIIPFYIMLIMKTFMIEQGSVHQTARVLRAMRFGLRVMRIARVFKLAHHSSGLRTIALALKDSLKELGLLLMFMSVGIFLFAELGYIMEQDHPETMFTSLPSSLWWAINSMATVGYGDMYPETTQGKCAAAVSFLCGILAITLPLNLIINNFVTIYKEQNVLEIIAKQEIERVALAEDKAQEAGEMPSQASDGNHSVRDCAGVTT